MDWPAAKHSLSPSVLGFTPPSLLPFRFLTSFVRKSAKWRTNGFSHILGGPAACRERFCVFTLRSSFMNQPAGRATSCQSEARYSLSIFQKISPYKQMGRTVEGPQKTEKNQVEAQQNGLPISKTEAKMFSVEFAPWSKTACCLSASDLSPLLTEASRFSLMWLRSLST